MGLLTNFKQNDVFRDEKSLAFDGSNDYVDISGAFNYNVHSISIWLKETTSSGQSTIFDYRDGNNDGINFYLAGGQPLYAVNNVDAHYTSALDLNQWSHIVLTNDGSTSTIYVNGVSVETADTSGETIDISGSAVPKIGRDAATGNYFTGNISEVAIYNSALTVNQAKTLYNGREPYNHKEGVASGNLQAWYRMGDGTLDSFGYNGIIGDETNAIKESNLVTNGSMEADSNWTNQSSPSTNERSTTQVYKGTYSRKFTPSSSNDGIKSDTFTTAVATYKITFWVYPDDSTKVSWKFVEHNGTSHSKSKTDLTQDTWNYIEFYAKSSSAGSNAYLAIMGSSDTSGDWYIDDVSINKLGGNAGLMTNMDAIDIEGDTP